MHPGTAAATAAATAATTAARHDWRSAWLRGVAPGGPGWGGPHAVVSLVPGQMLCIALTPPDMVRWASHVGERVWLDLPTRELSLAAPRTGEHHA